MAYGIPKEGPERGPMGEEEQDFFQPCYGPIVKEVGKKQPSNDGSDGGDGKKHWSGH